MTKRVELNPGWPWTEKIRITPGIKVGETVYTSGQVAFAPDGGVVGVGGEGELTVAAQQGVAVDRGEDEAGGVDLLPLVEAERGEHRLEGPVDPLYGYKQFRVVAGRMDRRGVEPGPSHRERKLGPHDAFEGIDSRTTDGGLGDPFGQLVQATKGESPGETAGPVHMGVKGLGADSQAASERTQCQGLWSRPLIE